MCVIAVEVVTGDTFEMLMPGIRVEWNILLFFPIIFILCVCVFLRRIALAKKIHANVTLKRTSL